MYLPLKDGDVDDDFASNGYFSSFEIVSFLGEALFDFDLGERHHGIATCSDPLLQRR